MPAFSRPTRASRESRTNETSHRSLRKRAHRLAIVAAMWRRQVMLMDGGEPAIQLLSGGQGPQGKKRRTESLFSWNVGRTTSPVCMTEREFKLRYRLDFDAFNKLVKIIRRDITVSPSLLSSRRLVVVRLVVVRRAPLLLFGLCEEEAHLRSSQHLHKQRLVLLVQDGPSEPLCPH